MKTIDQFNADARKVKKAVAVFVAGLGRSNLQLYFALVKAYFVYIAALEAPEAFMAAAKGAGIKVRKDAKDEIALTVIKWMFAQHDPKFQQDMRRQFNTWMNVLLALKDFADETTAQTDGIVPVGFHDLLERLQKVHIDKLVKDWRKKSNANKPKPNKPAEIAEYIAEHMIQLGEEAGDDDEPAWVICPDQDKVLAGRKGKILLLAEMDEDQNFVIHGVFEENHAKVENMIFAKAKKQSANDNTPKTNAQKEVA
jgi:hypothetical protein